jgi:hypothetical protein
MWDLAHSVLVDFLLPLAAAVLGAWLWTKYHASDFAAQHSAASTRKRIVKLESDLENFETIVNDPKRYIARMIILAMLILMLWITLMTITILMLMDKQGMLAALLISLPITIIFVLELHQLRLESLPNTYMDDIRTRIQRLRSRVAAQDR